MQRARPCLEGNLDRQVRIPELAALSSASVRYSSKTFQALYGEGPQSLSTRFRLAQAARLLLRTPLSVSEVGVACGFENNCSFSRAFRAQFGAPPSLYRLHGTAAAGPAAAVDMRRLASAGWAP